MLHKFLNYFFIITALFLSNCRKDEPDPIALRGKAYYLNPLLSLKDSLPLQNQRIEVYESTTGYSSNLITDSSGAFLFPGWASNSVFDLQTKLEINNSNQYKAVYLAKKRIVDAEIQKASLIATIDTPNYRALILSVKDIYGGKFSGAKILIYTNRTIAMADTSFIGYNTLANLVTSQNGNCLLMQLNDSIFIKSNYIAGNILNLKSNILALKINTAYLDTSIIVR